MSASTEPATQTTATDSATYTNERYSQYPFSCEELAEYMNLMPREDYNKISQFYYKADTREEANWPAYLHEIDMDLTEQKGRGIPMDLAHIKTVLRDYLTKAAVDGGNSGMKLPEALCAPSQDVQLRVFGRTFSPGLEKTE